MAERSRSSYLWSWKQTLIICLTILLGQALSTWYITSKTGGSTQNATSASDQEVSSRRPAQRREAPRGGPGSDQGPEAAGRPGPGEPDRGEEDDTSTPGPDAPGPKDDRGPSDGPASPPARGANAVERLDDAMSRRVEALAAETGRDAQALLPGAELRESAITTGDLRSAESQELIGDYTRILEELRSSTPPAEGGSAPSPDPGAR
jgi:hypothetical protein